MISHAAAALRQTHFVPRSPNFSLLGSGRALKVMADFDMGGGRTGARGAARTVALARQIASTPRLHYAGLQAYNGEILCIPGYEERRQASLACLEPVREVIAQLTAEGLAPQIVSGSGTGTHDIDPAAAVFTEVQAGTYVLMDVNYGHVQLRSDGPGPFGHAVTVSASVVSAPGGGYVITDGGAKEIDGVFAELQPMITAGAPEGSRYSIVGDDLGRIDLPAQARSPEVGGRVSLVPPHAWQTVPMYRAYHCVSGDTLVDIWPVDAQANW